MSETKGYWWCEKCKVKLDTRPGGWIRCGQCGDKPIWIDQIEGKPLNEPKPEPCMEEMRQRLEKAEAVVRKLRAAWRRSDTYGHVEDGSSADRASRNMREFFRKAAEAAGKAAP